MSTRTRSALLLATAIAWGLPLSAQDAVTLRLDPPVGQVTHIRMEGRTWMLSGAAPADTSHPTSTQLIFGTQTVTAAETGIRAISTVIDSSRMEVGGGMPSPLGATDLLKGTTSTRRVNADGDALSTTVVPGPNLPPMMSEQASVPQAGPQHGFPKRPLRVGETWTDTGTTAPRPGMSHAVTTVITYRLERIESRDGGPYATVSMRGGTGVPADSAHATSVSGDFSGEMLIDVTHRRMVRFTNENRTRVDAPGGPQTILGRMTITATEP